MAEYSVEYARTGRSRCKKCKVGIAQDELRVGRTQQGFGDFEQTTWFHPSCVPNGKMRKAALSEYQGLKKLTKKDQDTFKQVLFGGQKTDKDDEEAKPRAKRARDSAVAAPVPVKKAKTAVVKKAKAAPGSAWKGYTAAQYAQFKELKSEFLEMANPALKELCRKNDQKVTGTKEELADRCADGKLLGAIPKCGACGGGRLRFNAKSGLYSCPGYMEDEDFIHCNKTFSLSEVSRTPWQA